MKRAIQRIILSLLAVAAAGFITFVIVKNNQYRETMMEIANEEFPSTISCLRFMYNPFNKTLIIQNLHIGNPLGYESYNVINIPKVKIKFNSMDLESNAFAIESLYIDHLDLNYELQGTRTSNLSELIDALEALETKGAAQLRIDRFEIAHVNIGLSSVLMKKEIANLDSEGFVLEPFKLRAEIVDELDMAEHSLRILLMRTCERLSLEKKKTTIRQFAEGAEQVLAQISDKNPELAKRLQSL